MGFQPSKADTDIWMKPTDDRLAYDYIAVYVDDLCVASKDLEDLSNPQEQIQVQTLTEFQPKELFLFLTLMDRRQTNSPDIAPSSYSTKF